MLVSELVDAQVVGSIWVGIVFFDHVVGVSEILEPDWIFGFGGVCDLVFCEEVYEGKLYFCVLSHEGDS